MRLSELSTSCHWPTHPAPGWPHDATNVPSTTVITGGAGFIGSHLSERVCAAGRQLLIVDDLSSGRLENIDHLLDDPCRFIHARVSDALGNQPHLFDDVSHIFHLAASVGVKTAIEDPLSMAANNIDETRAVLDLAQRTGAAVLIASSSEVYGKTTRLPMGEQDDLVLGPPHSPRWSYALSKALDEQLAMAYARQRGVGVVIGRFFNMIGPRQVGRYGMVVPRFVQQAVAGENLTIYGDGAQRRTFCDVRDAVDAMVALLDDPQHHGRVFNLGADQEITIEALADLVIELAGGRSIKQFVPYEKAYAGHYEDPPRRLPDLSRIRAAIGFRPRITLRDTLIELIDQVRRRDGDITIKPGGRAEQPVAPAKAVDASPRRR